MTTSKKDRLSKKDKIKKSEEQTSEYGFVVERFKGLDWKEEFDSIIDFINISFVDMNEGQIIDALDNLPRIAFKCGMFLSKLRRDYAKLDYEKERVLNLAKIQSREEIEMAIEEGLVTSQISESLVFGWVIKNHGSEYGKIMERLRELKEFIDNVSVLYNQIENKKFMLQTQIKKFAGN